ncbi:hypothetical protein HDV62DRAFT_324698 [Trichoderma sp. SZMC 28011]
MLGAAFFSLFFLFFTWLGYRHTLDKSILKDETTDLFLYKGDALNPLPKGGISNIITLLTYDVAFHASDMRLRGRRGVCMARKD